MLSLKDKAIGYIFTQCKSEPAAPFLHTVLGQHTIFKTHPSFLADKNHIELCHCTVKKALFFFFCIFFVTPFLFYLIIFKSSSNYCTCITALKKHVFPRLLSPLTVTSELVFEGEFSSLRETSFSCSFLLSFSTFLFPKSLFSCCFSAGTIEQTCINPETRNRIGKSCYRQQQSIMFKI